MGQIYQLVTYLHAGADNELIEEFLEAYEKGDDNYIHNLASQWDVNPEAEYEENPRIANYDNVLLDDDEYYIAYNTTIGGDMAIWYKVSPEEYEREMQHQGLMENRRNKRRYHLKESELRKIIKESVTRILSEMR